MHELDDEEAQYHSKSPKQEPENDDGDDIEFFDPAVQLFDSGNGGQEQHCMQDEDEDGDDEDDGDDRDETEVNDADEEEKNATIKTLNDGRSKVENLPPTSSAQGYFENTDG